MAIVLMEKSNTQGSALENDSPGRGIEVVVHVNETLDDDQRDDLKNYLESQQGIGEVEFCPNRFHLMLVTYDSDVMSSQTVLQRVKSHNMHAQLVGPI